MQIQPLEGWTWRDALAFGLRVLSLPCTFRFVLSRTPRTLDVDAGAGSEVFVGECMGLKSMRVLLMLSHKVDEVGEHWEW